MRTFTAATAALSLLSAPATAMADCAMTRLTIHNDPAHTAILAAPSGERSIYFHAKLDVNTDGASRSYHPDDPRGRTLALNNIGNALTEIRDADGRVINCTPRSGACFTRYINTFEAARDAGWNRNGHPSVRTNGIIPWRYDSALGREAPCRNAQGYFVSQTAFVVAPGRPVCDQARYLDALSYNAIVLPGGAIWRSQGWKADQGDLAVVRDRSTGRVAYAIVGDVGPARNLGEGSVALAASLGEATLDGDETYAEVRRLARHDVDYVVFNGREIRPTFAGVFSQSDIDRLGREAFDAWGGLQRLDACRAVD